MVVRKKVNANGRVVWQVDLGKVNGKRLQRSFKVREEAEDFLKNRKLERRQTGDNSLALNEEDRTRFGHAKRRLAGVGSTVDQAVDFYLAHHQPLKEKISLGTLLDRFLLDKAVQGVREKYIAQLRCSCASFVLPRKNEAPGQITREEIKAWITGARWAPKTQRVYLGDLRTFFGWATAEGYLSRSPLDLERRHRIKLAKMVDREPAIFAPEQIERMFKTALEATENSRDPSDWLIRPRPVYRALIGYLALATFAGVRPHELTRLEVGAVDLEGKVVALAGNVTKTSDRRVVDLSPNCIAWLKLWRGEFPQLTHVAPPSWDRHLKGLRKRAALRPWPHDVLRHCFASYYHAIHQDKTKLQAQMGHSEGQDTLDRHYRAVRTADGRTLTRAVAEAFWGITPPNPSACPSVRPSQGKSKCLL